MKRHTGGERVKRVIKWANLHYVINEWPLFTYQLGLLYILTSCALQMLVKICILSIFVISFSVGTFNYYIMGPGQVVKLSTSRRLAALLRAAYLIIVCLISVFQHGSSNHVWDSSRKLFTL